MDKDVSSDAAKPPPPLRWRFLVAGLLIFTATGAVAGYTGVMKTEYKMASPVDNALIVAVAGNLHGWWWIGLAIGCLVDVVRWRRWKKRPQA